MKIPSAQTVLATRSRRGIGLIISTLLFVLAVFQLTHLPRVSADGNLVDLWRGLAVGSLYLLFCFPTADRPQSGP